MKKIVFALLSLSILFSSCQKEDDVTPLGVKFEGKVYDEKSKKPLEGVVLEIITGSNTYTATSNDKGLYSFEKLPQGEFTVSTQFDGYFSNTFNFRSDELAVNESSELLVINQKLALSPLSETYSTTVYKKGTSGHVVLVFPNAPYTLTFMEGNYEQLSGKSDAAGNVVIENLPYDIRCKIEFDFTEGEHTYKGYDYFDPEDEKDDNIVLKPVNKTLKTLGLLSSNVLTKTGDPVKDFALNGKITAQFTHPVDISPEAYSITLHNNFSVYSDLTFEWSQDNTVVTITPSVLSKGVGQHLEFHLKDKEGKLAPYYQKVIFYTADQ